MLWPKQYSVWTRTIIGDDASFSTHAMYLDAQAIMEMPSRCDNVPAMFQELQGCTHNYECDVLFDSRRCDELLHDVREFWSFVYSSSQHDFMLTRLCCIWSKVCFLGSEMQLEYGM